MTALRRVIQDHWEALGAPEPAVASRFAVSDIAVSTPHGAVSAAVDGEGYRHLLIPLPANQILEPDVRSRGVHLVLRELGEDRRRYADLVLRESALADVFTSLCADVVGAIASRPDAGVRLTREILDAWRSLLDGATPRLSVGAAAGLFAELVVLERLLACDRGAASTWSGPFGVSHDFHRLDVSIEVKASLALDGRTFRVHGLDQLDEGNGRLWLAWFRLERRPDTGTTLSEIVARVLVRTDDERLVHRALANVGYRSDDEAEHSVTRYTVADEQWYDVTPQFPRLVARDLADGHVAAGVHDVHYTVDLEAVPRGHASRQGALDALLGLR